MGAYRDSGIQKKYFKLIGKVDDVDKEHGWVIAERIKVTGEEDRKEWHKGLSGYLVSATTKEYEWPKDSKEMKTSFVLELQDSEGISHLEFSASGPGYGLINSLLDADLTKELAIEGWVNKGGYVNAGAKYKGMKDGIPWAIPVPSQPKPIEFSTPGGKVLKDYANVQSFWILEFKKISFKAISQNFPKELLELQKTAEPLNAPKSNVNSVSAGVNQQKRDNSWKDENWPDKPPVEDDDDLDAPF